MRLPQDLVDVAIRAAMKTKTSLPHPTPTTTTTAVPTHLPTVVPDIPRVYFQEAGETGMRTLWVVFVLMAVSSIVFYIMAARVVVQKRLFHIITSFIATIAFLSYFAMATGDGVTWHATAVKTTKHGVVEEIVNRQVFWARYVDWTLTTPLLLLELGLIAGLDGASILVTVGANVIMVLTGLFAAFGHTTAQTWGWYTIACIAFLTIVYQIGYKGRAAVRNRDTKTKAFFGGLSLFALLILIAYPIIWGIADGSRHLSVDGEIIAYAVLDILAKPVFGLWLLMTHDAMARTTPTVEGFWAHGLLVDGTLRVGDGRRIDED